MKKIYNTPDTQVVVVETMQMIAESMNVYEEKKSFGSSLSREAEWDDED